MKKRKRVLAAALCVVMAAGMALSLTACGSDEEEKSKSGLTEVDVVLDWYPNAVHEFLYDARDKGYFKDEGLKVKIVEPAESVDAMNFVATGKAEIGISYPYDTINAVVNSEMPVKAIGAVLQKDTNCMASLKSSGISLSDPSTLKGKKIGYSGEESAKATVQNVMSYIGLSEDDYELIDVGFDLTTALASGKVDLVSGTFINDEIITMKNAGYDLDVWDYSDYGVPEFYGLVFIANSEAYEKDPETYQAFLRACRKGFEDMKSDEDAAVETIMKDMKSDDNELDETQQRQSYETLLSYMETEDGNFLTMKKENWQSYIDWAKKNGLIDKKCKVSDVMIAPEFD